MKQKMKEGLVNMVWMKSQEPFSINSLSNFEYDTSRLSLRRTPPKSSPIKPVPHLILHINGFRAPIILISPSSRPFSHFPVQLSLQLHP